MKKADIRGKWALVTGASRGIGRQVCMGLAQYGCNLVLHSRDAANTKSLAAELTAKGVQVRQVAGELSDQNQVDAMLTNVLSAGTGIDILYNNAAVMTTFRNDWQNVPAVLDKTELTQLDKEVFKNYAAQTCSGYCAGCANICDAAVAGVSNISDVMRSLMYHNSYGDNQLARQTFAEIPADVRARLLTADYRFAEQRCPQRMPIARLVREAVEKLARQT